MTETATTVRASEEAKTAVPGKYLTFEIGDEIYGIDILKVQEIIGVMPVTRMPEVAPHIRGVINLRGKVIPLMDMRIRFNLESCENTSRTCFIVVRTCGNGTWQTSGIVVDRVREVQDIAEEQIEAAPSLGTIDTSFILGMGKIGQTVAMLLDIDAVLRGSTGIQIEAA